MLSLCGLQESFNTGDYINAVVNRQKAETISNVLYPDDRSYQVSLILIFREVHSLFFLILVDVLMAHAPEEEQLLR